MRLGRVGRAGGTWKPGKSGAGGKMSGNLALDLSPPVLRNLPNLPKLLPVSPISPRCVQRPFPDAQVGYGVKYETTETTETTESGESVMGLGMSGGDLEYWVAIGGIYV